MTTVTFIGAGSVTGFCQLAAVRVPGRVTDCVTDCVTDLIAEPLREPILAVAR